MSSDVFSSVLSSLPNEIMAAVLALVASYFLYRFTQKRKLVEYSVSSISLLRLRPGTDNVVVVHVRKDAITRDPADHNDLLPLSTVYGFQILLNVGNEDIEKIDDIEIRFDPAAKIVRCETDPLSTPGYTITTRKDSEHFNILHLLVPYLNAKTSLVIRLITSENANSSCTVKVHGIGIQTRLAKSHSFIRNLGRIIFIALYLPAAFMIMTLGLTIKSFSIIPDTPIKWVFWIILFISIIVAWYTGHSIKVQAKRQEFSQDWDWEVPEVSKKQSFLQRLFS